MKQNETWLFLFQYALHRKLEKKNHKTFYHRKKVFFPNLISSDNFQKGCQYVSKAFFHLFISYTFILSLIY